MHKEPPTVIFPERLKHIEEIATAFREAEIPKDSDKIGLDFTRVKYGEPFAMLYARARVIELTADHPKSTFMLFHDADAAAKSKFYGYAAHIGYFQAMGFDLGKPIGFARGSRRYFPIERWEIDDLRSESGADPVAKLVDKRSTRLAEILTQEKEGDRFELLQFAIREVSRNAIEHSRGTEVYLHGQYWPTKNEAEIVVFDNGVGISETLYDLEHIAIANNLAGMKVALLPGVSGVSRSERAQQDTNWRNSGFGLYIVSRYCGRFGSFDILSNGDHLRLSGNRQVEKKVPFRGTAVCAHLRLSEIQKLSQLHEKIITEGEKTQSELLQDYEISASAASKHLLRHFNIKVS